MICGTPHELLAYTFANLCFGRKPKAKVVTKVITIFILSIANKCIMQDFGNLCFVELSLFNPSLSNLLLIDEELHLHEHVFNSNHLQLSNPMEGIICLFNFLSKEPNLCLQVLQLFLCNGSMARYLLDILLQTFNGFDRFFQIVYLGAQPRVKICIFFLKSLGPLCYNYDLTHIHCNYEF